MFAYKHEDIQINEPSLTGLTYDRFYDTFVIFPPSYCGIYHLLKLVAGLWVSVQVNPKFSTNGEHLLGITDQSFVRTWTSHEVLIVGRTPGKGLMRSEIETGFSKTQIDQPQNHFLAMFCTEQQLPI